MSDWPGPNIWRTSGQTWWRRDIFWPFCCLSQKLWGSLYRSVQVRLFFIHADSIRGILDFIFLSEKRFFSLVFVLLFFTHNGWKFRDDCTEFIHTYFLHPGFLQLQTSHYLYQDIEMNDLKTIYRFKAVNISN